MSFRRLAPQQVIDLAAGCGLDSIEWGGDIHVPAGEFALAAEIGERTRTAGLDVACYGSYYRLTDAEDGMSERVVATARALGAPLIRVWAGAAGSADASPAQRDEICRNARQLAELAASEEIDVAFEYHGGTLTDTAESALALLRAVDRPNVGTLWQPPMSMSAADCLLSIRTVAPYIRNIHVFSWNGVDRQPLDAGAKRWRAYLSEIERLPGEHRLMLEFVRGDDPAQLVEDAACLARWLEGRWNA